MAKLNDKNEQTKYKIHLMITTLCNRSCPDCCNFQYDIDNIPTVTEKELREAKVIYLTGGEPFAYGNPNAIARYLKGKYSNIQKVYAYSNAFELGYYLQNDGRVDALNGITISIKAPYDKQVFEDIIKDNLQLAQLESNWVYLFEPYQDMIIPERNFTVRNREWQKDFVPESHSIFRRI